MSRAPTVAGVRKAATGFRTLVDNLPESPGADRLEDLATIGMCALKAAADIGDTETGNKVLADIGRLDRLRTETIDVHGAKRAN